MFVGLDLVSMQLNMRFINASLHILSAKLLKTKSGLKYVNKKLRNVKLKNSLVKVNFLLKKGKTTGTNRRTMKTVQVSRPHDLISRASSCEYAIKNEGLYENHDLKLYECYIFIEPVALF